MELWKPVYGFPKYEVSTLGKVRSYRTRLLKSQSPSHSYYYKVSLRKDNRTLHRFVHTIVGRSFFEDYKEGLFILHKDEELPWPNINYLDNLYLGTKLDNNRDAINKGRHIPFFNLVNHKGEHNPASKLDEAKVRYIRELNQQGVTQTRLAEMFGVSQSTIWRVLHTHWQYT